ncbi:Periplasmic beta-glucosidase precursor [compost metagenome]
MAGFARVSLASSEIKEVTFEVDMRQLAFHDLNMEQVVEPGKMELFIGASSQDIRLQGTFEIIGEKLIVERKVFSSKVTVDRI